LQGYLCVVTDKTIRLDATTLRGLAHPLRVRILGLLREHGPATATTLAELLGQSTGATSYHLRQLAAYGFVVDDPDRNVGRERWWKAAHRTTNLDHVDDPADAEGYLRAVAAQYAERVDRFLGELGTLPEEWLETFTLSDWRLRLTPEEGKRLHEEMFALIGRYRRDPQPGEDEPGSGAPEGAEKVVVQVGLMPFLAGDGA
jgi:DNA-binding transcriptional ArsR family regulator